MDGKVATVDPLTNAEAARVRVLLLAQATFILVSAAAATCVGALLTLLFPEQSAKFAAWAIGLKKFSTVLDKAFSDGGTAGFAARLPWLCAGLIGGTLAWRKRKLVRQVADWLFPPLDSELLRPIERAGTLDPLWAPADPQTGVGMQPLAWAEPAAPPLGSEEPPTARRRVGNRLLAFLSEDVGDGRFDLLGQPRAPMARFRWILLTGQPGLPRFRIRVKSGHKPR
jgi:hypothetical protein